ncbi:MAG: hypothetical protein KKG00_00580 [Bacteroidetes bacterium]|nr:hypothetical protein [Bacteroidota bacterium]
MSKLKSTSHFLAFAYTFVLMAFIGCQSIDPTPDSIDPGTQPSDLTKALKINGKLKSGGLLAGVNDPSFRIEKYQPSASVTSDNSLFVPFVYTIGSIQKLKGIYLQVEGADVYWDIPYQPSKARLGDVNANPERNGFVLDVGIPAHILAGNFRIFYQLYDDKGKASEPVPMQVGIVQPVDFCANGGTTLGLVKGQDGMTVRSYELGNKAGWVTIRYNTFTVKDRIDIQYAGEWVRSTGQLLEKGQTPPVGQCNNVSAANGFVGQKSELNVYYDPKKGKRIDIYVSGCLDGGTQWEFEVTDCPSERAYLGIHSSEPANDCKNDCTNYGHAWVSLTDNGKTTYYGLWPDWHPEVTKRGLANGKGSDIRTGIESGFGEQTRYYLLDNTQKESFEIFLQRNLTYNPLLYNCTSFVGDIVYASVGERIKFKKYGLPLPCALSTSIVALNTSNPTINYTPIGMKYTNFSRSFCEPKQ